MVRAVVFDLLMAVMDSLRVWAAAAGDEGRGLAWRDGVTARMRHASAYSDYDSLVRAEAEAQELDRGAIERLVEAWQAMEPWPDAASVANIMLPYGFLTNCSATLAQVAAGRSGLRADFTLSAEDAGWYKPHPHAYLAACRLLARPPAEVLFVAGSPYDAEGAARAGLATLLVRRRSDLAPARGVTTISSLADMQAEL